MDSLMSFLRAFTVNDFYSAAGLYRGSLPAGFSYGVLMRDTGLGATGGGFLVGNLEVGVGGWLVQLSRGVTELGITFGYVDGAAADQGAVGNIIDSPNSQRTMLLTVFVGVDNGAANPGLYAFINGTLIRFEDNDFHEMATGYTAATADNPFRLGAHPGLATAAGAIAGFAFGNSAPSGADTDAALLACAEIATEQWEAVQASEDLLLTDGFTDVFSVRRGLPNPADTWLATAGGEELERQGVANLLVEAARPRFWSGFWQAADGGNEPIAPNGAMFYGLTAGTGNPGASDYPGTVAVKTVAGSGRVPFPRLGPLAGGVDAPVPSALPFPDSFLIPEAGIYEVTFRVHTTEPGQLQVELDGVDLPETLATNMNPTAGGHPIIGNAFITVPAGGVLAIVNPVGNAAALTITPADGAHTHANAQTLTIKRVG